MTNRAGDARPSIVNVVAPGRFGGAGGGGCARGYGHVLGIRVRARGAGHDLVRVVSHG